jgi:DNA-binding SARP family transcriptional activator
MTPAPLQLQLLATPQLLRRGQALHVGSRKALALLGVLALDGSVARERLATLLWPDADAAAARRNLRREIFRLRELGVPLLEQPGGALALDHSLDVDARALLGDGALSESPVRALEGLDGVGSPALDDWLQAARERLSRRWRQRVLALAQQAEEAGDTDRALQLFAALHEADPLREITICDLMRVHGARGQRNAALQLFDAFAQRLDRELGVAPLPETAALAERLRDSAPRAAPPLTPSLTPSLTRTPPAQAQLPRLAPFVGRSATVSALQQAWRQGRLMLVAGEAGEGKSRLVSEVMATQGAGLHVALRPSDQPEPYAAAARLLRELLAAAGDTPLPDDVRQEIARVLPELGPAAPLTSSAEQQRFTQACARAVLQLAADNFSAIAVDDLHNADAASRGLLLSMAQRGGAALRWVFAYRGSELGSAAHHELQAVAQGGAALHVALGPLNAAAVAALVRTLSGSDAPRFALRLHQATGGNPFFLIETLRHLFERGLVQVDATGLWETPFDASTADYHELPIPATVRDAVRARVARLGEGAMRLLEAASLLGGPFATRWLEGSSSLSDLELVAALEAAEAAHLLAPAEPAAAGTPDYRWTHDLVPQSLAAGLSPARAALLHRKLALALEQATPGAAATRIARHWELAHEPRRAVHFRIQAGMAAARLFAHHEALAEFERALTHGPDRAQEVTLRNARIEALRYLGDVAARGVEAEALMTLARAHGDRNLEADAAIQRALALTDASHRREAWRVLEHAVALAPDDEVTLLRALRIAGWAAMTCGETARSRELLLRAIPIAERIDASAACSSISVLLRLATDAGDYDEGQRLYARARTHPGLSLRPMIHFQVLTDGARLLEACGERTEALRLQRDALVLAERMGAVPNLLTGRFNLMRMLFNGGDVAGGRALALGFAPLTEGAEHPQRQYMGLSALAQLAAAEERWSDAVNLGQRVVTLCDGLDDPLQRRAERVLLAHSHLQAGEHTAARDVALAAQAIDPDPPRVLLSAKAAEVEARLLLEPQNSAALLRDIEEALAAPALPEEERRAALEQAWLARARLLLALGRGAEAAAAVAGVYFTPALRAMAERIGHRAGLPLAAG